MIFLNGTGITLKKAINMVDELKEVEEIISKKLAENELIFEEGKSNVTVGWPIFDKKEIMAVIRTLLEGRVSQGKYVKQFENEYAKKIGMKNSIAVNSGSSANLIAIDALIQKGRIKKGSEVIVPAATFATVVSPIIQLGLVPVFVDVESDSYNISPEEIKKAVSDKTSLIMPVHSLGNPAKMEEIMEIAESFSLPVLEDCCESHGAMIGNKNIGSFGEISTLSFFVAHNITTGEGGMIFCEDPQLAEICKALREFGRRMDKSEKFPFVNKELGEYDVRYVFDRLGYNMRMTDIEASIGLEQLKKLNQFNDVRIENAKFFIDELSEFSSLKMPEIRSGTLHSFYSFPILVEDTASFKRTEIVSFLQDNKIETRPFLGGNLVAQPAFKNQNIRISGNLEQSKKIAEKMFFIGCHPKIGKNERNYVISKFREFMKKH